MTMAAITLYTTFRSTPRPDGLCPNCNNPSLKLYFLERISMAGVTVLGERLACADEKKWVSDLKAYEDAEA